jgi:hypothetical protein
MEKKLKTTTATATKLQKNTYLKKITKKNVSSDTKKLRKKQSKQMVNMNELKNELIELFKDGYEEVFFRDMVEDNAIMDRFKDKNNDHIICFILCEYEPYEDTIVNLHYDYSYGGSDKLATIKTKYKLNHEWETNCLASLYVDEELYEESEDEDSD